MTHEQWREHEFSKSLDIEPANFNNSKKKLLYHFYSQNDLSNPYTNPIK
jgi:hypothetical protein